MKRAIVTITCGSFFERMAEITHPTIRAYAERLGADFIVWNDYTGHTIPHFKKLELGRLLDRYDRVLFLDTDILVRDDAPDIFELVPEDRLGMLDEGQYFEPHKRMMATIDLMHSLGYDPDLWDGKYYNTGVIVLSRAQCAMFVQPEVEWQNFFEQTYFNYLIASSGQKVFPLPHRFNRVFCMDPVYGEERFDAYFLHYAGLMTMMSEDDLLALIERDLAAWHASATGYHFGKHFVFVVEGGVGEQIAAEPAIRYARDTADPSDGLAIVSSWPEIFAHLELPIYATLDAVPQAAHARCRYSLSGPPGSAGPARERMHCVNFASLRLLDTELPLDRKTPRLQIDGQALAALANRVSPRAPAKLALVHPARASAADTFPAAFWQTYVDHLVAGGVPVAIVGTSADGEFPVVEFDRSRCLDLVDRLSLRELIALVSQAPVLVTSHSPMIHVAGAFDKWIGLVAPSQHPEYLLHWRNGTQFWRVRILQQTPRYSDPPRADVDGQKASLDRLAECVPSPADVLSFVRTCAGSRLGVRLRAPDAAHRDTTG